MTDRDVSAAILHADRSIEAYVARCRQRVPEFVTRHFSLEQTWQVQRRSLWVDLLVGAVNSAWSIPYLTIKKICAGLDAVGVSAAAQALLFIPPGIKTGYQRAIENLIAREVLEWDLASDTIGLPQGLSADLERHGALRAALRGGLVGREPGTVRSIRAVLDGFASGRALVSDVSASLLTIAYGWYAFGTMSLGLRDVAGRLAQRNAHDRSASQFIFGKRVGSVFYDVFKPAASPSETLTILVVLGAAITAGAMACTLGSDPIRKAFGLHERRLGVLIDGLERELVVFSQKRLRKSVEQEKSST
jgi:hypothetical protein